MASAGDVAAWKQLGGTVRTVKKNKEFIAPGGEKFTSWAEASEFAKTIDKASKPDAEAMDVDQKQQPASSSKKAASAAAKKSAPAKPRAKRAGTAGAAAAANDAEEAKKNKKAKKTSTSSSPSSEAAAATAAVAVGSGRAAAQNIKFEFDGANADGGAGSRRRSTRDDVVEVKEAREAESEQQALELLGAAASRDGRHRLLDLTVFDGETGELVPLDRVGLTKAPLFASAVLSKSEAAPRSAGVSVARLGPLSSLGVDGVVSSAAEAEHYAAAAAPVALTLTSQATGHTYVVSRASSAYRRALQHALEQAELAADTSRALAAAVAEAAKSAAAASAAANPRPTPPSYDSVVVRLARARAGKPYGGPRAALEACGAFVLEALEKHAPALIGASASAAAAAPAAVVVNGAAFAAELEKKVEEARGSSGRAAAGASRGNGITITDAADAKKEEDGDKGKGKAPAVAAADDKGKGKAAVVSVNASSTAASAHPLTFKSKASSLPLADRLALRERDHERQLAAKAASQQGLVALQTDAGGRRTTLVTAAQADRAAARAAANAAASSAADASGNGNGAYIVLSMSELADEYPPPEQAPDREEDAWDEIEFLADEDFYYNSSALSTVDPESLPAYDLFDFSIFNGDSMLTPLELLPAFSGVEPPVEMFAMGRFVDHDEGTAFAKPEDVVAVARATADANAAGGSSSAAAAGGSSSSAAASPEPTPIGNPLLLSQIQEWYVEGAFDLDASPPQIWVRTELARYRLVTPSARYGAWFAVVQKAVRWAIRAMHQVEGASRASKVSFDDVVRSIAAEPEASRDFVSRDRRAVERFLVCHGQIILNQFGGIPGKDTRAIKQCAFTQTLRSKMLERRHLKLYAPSKAALRALQQAAAAKGKKQRGAGGGGGAATTRRLRSNPMKDRPAAASKHRAAPMTATATAMVRAVWQSYFAAAGVGKKSGGGGDGSGGGGDDENDTPVGDGSSAAIAAKAIALKDYNSKAKKEEEEGADGVAKPVEEPDDEEDEAAAAGAAGTAAAAPAAVASSDARSAAAKPLAVERPKTAPRVLGKPLPGPVDVTPLGLPASEASSVAFYSEAEIGDGDRRAKVAVGDVVSLARGVKLESLGDHDDVARSVAACADRAAEEGLPASPLLGIVQAIFVDRKTKTPRVQVRVAVHGCDTVLGDAASDAELFATPRFAAFDLADAGERLDAARRVRRWDARDTALHAAEAAEDEALRSANNAKLERGQPLRYIWRTAYLPLKGMFQILPADLELGKPQRNEPAPEKGLAVGPEAGTFKKDGVVYSVGDAVYLPPDAFDVEEEAKGGGGEEGKPAAKKAKKKASSSSGSGKKGKASANDDDEEEEEEEQEDDDDEEEDQENVNVDKDGKPLPGSRSRFHKGGANLGLRAFAVGIISAVPKNAGSNPRSATITVARCARPEDVSEETAYESGWWDIFATNEAASVDAATIVSKCYVVKKTSSSSDPIAEDAAPAAVENVFTCVGTADLRKKAVERGALPASLALRARDDVVAELARENKALAAAAVSAAEMHKKSSSTSSKAQGDGVSLATMDIFAGCGGLSEGLHQYRAAHARWAVEYEHPAAMAYRLNNPDAEVFEGNCNVVLAAAMDKAGVGDQCRRSEACAEEVAKWKAAAAAGKDGGDGSNNNNGDGTTNGRWSALPAPGDVEFLCGGPPCQGYSGMNRFNKGNWSMVQNSMVMSYLSFADFYRPRYFLLENVRNFVSHNKSFTFRLTLRSLLEMGYSVRFGVLNAGNFGVSQSRKRTFIWAAAPGEKLPEWPSPRHVFKSPQLTVNLPGGVQYSAVPSYAKVGGGAPLRTVTVRDAIGDLPEIGNGHDDGGDGAAKHVNPPKSAFQRMIRSGLVSSSSDASSQLPLYDHISKTMNEVNMERCRCIPKGVPGADWRVLKKIVADDRKLPEDRQRYRDGKVRAADGRVVGDLVPWCLPNTEARHNGWRGLFGRLDPRGHFPTSTTDPQPMGKVGQVFHPTQDRIVSVRECARAQGFPDDFRLWGNVHQRHRQVGNAVPVPLSAALGKQLRAALEETAAARAAASSASKQ